MAQPPSGEISPQHRKLAAKHLPAVREWAVAAASDKTLPRRVTATDKVRTELVDIDVDVTEAVHAVVLVEALRDELRGLAIELAEGATATKPARPHWLAMGRLLGVWRTTAMTRLRRPKLK